MPSLSNSPWILGSARQRPLKTHSSDQIAHVFADPRSAAARTRLLSPVSGKTHSVPTHDGLWPDDSYGAKDARAATVEPNEQDTVGPTQMHSTWYALLQNILMPQYQDFGFQPLSRLEAVTQHADEQEADCNHSAIMV